MAMAMFQGGGAEKEKGASVVYKEAETRLAEIHKQVGLNVVEFLIGLDLVQPLKAALEDGDNGQILRDVILRPFEMTDLTTSLILLENEAGSRYINRGQLLVADYVAENSADPGFTAGINLIRNLATYIYPIMEKGALAQSGSVLDLDGIAVKDDEIIGGLQEDARGLSIFRNMSERLQAQCDVSSPFGQSKREGVKFATTLVYKATDRFTNQYLDELASLHTGKRS